MHSNCNQLDAMSAVKVASNIDNILSPLFATNVLPMFRMQYFCNNVRFATTPICNTFLLNKDIWSRKRQIFQINIFRTNFSPYTERPWVCHDS